MNILVGLIILAIGAAITIYSEKVMSAFGRIAFFETHLGTDGGSRLGYKLLGILIAFLGILVITNLIGDFLSWILGPLIRLGHPQ